MASRIHKRKDSNTYIVSFANEITNRSSQVFSSSIKKEAIEKCRDLDCEFYSENPYLIPPGISLDKEARRFRVYTRYGHMKSHKTLMDAVEQKHNIINDLIEMKNMWTGRTSLITNEK